MYALFTAIPLVGHLNPLIYQALEMQQRGWRVAVAAVTEMAAHVRREAPGIPFIDLGPLGDIANELRRREHAASLDANLVRGTLGILDGLALVWPVMFDSLSSAITQDRPDVMVVDLFTSAGLSAANHHSIPTVVNNADLLGVLPVTLLPPADHLPALFSGQSRHAVRGWQKVVGPVIRRVAAVGSRLTVERRLNQLRASSGLAPIAVDALLRDLPILVNGFFGLEYERHLPPQVEMVGPMLPTKREPLPEELERWLSNGDPVVYCNLGTLAVAPDALLSEIAAALANHGRRALWILKREQAQRLPKDLSSSLRVLEWGPSPLSVLSHPNVSAFVSHCGINSAHEAIVAGTPIVGIPMFADQRDQAVRVADAGVGVWIDKQRVTRDSLRAAIERVIADPKIPERMQLLQAAMVRAGGVRRAADVIESASRARARSPQP
jgi:UDP:flavonoid glycosyltransferase YjiC (YdhE family)